MNNTKYYNDSLAYDFQMFMPRENRESRATVVKMPERKVNKASRRKARKKVSRTASVIMIGLLLVTMVCAGIALRVEITEVNSEIINAKGQLADLSGEETRINMEFERLMSYKNIEEAAQALGMRKMDKSQIVYIRVNETNKAVDADGNILTADNE